MATLSVISVLLLPAASLKASSPVERNYKESYRYAHAAAKKYRRQRDDLQQRLTRRVLEVRALRRQLAAVHRRIVHRPDSIEAIRLAANAYHVDYNLLLGIASCESRLNPYAKNRHSTASGLMQFLTSTWARTPYARESIWSPYANAMAGAWLISRGGRGQWVC